MGNKVAKEAETKKDVEEGEVVFDPAAIYWDDHGHLRLGHNKRDRGEELLKLLMTDVTTNVDVWVIIPSRWIRLWLVFAHLKKGDAPGEIDTTVLLAKDKKSPTGWRPKKTLLPPKLAADKFEDDFPGHYRRITEEAWLMLIDMYGIKGPAIAVVSVQYTRVVCCC